MAYWYIILLLSSHPKKHGWSYTFHHYKEITCVCSLAVHIFNWTVWQSYIVHDKLELLLLLFITYSPALKMESKIKLHAHIWVMYLFLNSYIFNVLDQPIGIMVRVFANGPGDWSSIPSWVILKMQKMIYDSSLLNTQHYKVYIKDKWSNLGKRVGPSLTPWYSNYWKGSLWVTLVYG